MAASVGLHAVAAWAAGWWLHRPWHLEPIHVISVRLLEVTGPEAPLAAEPERSAGPERPIRAKRAVSLERKPLASYRGGPEPSGKTTIAQKPPSSRARAEPPAPSPRPPAAKTVRPRPGASLALAEPGRKHSAETDGRAGVRPPVERGSLVVARAEPRQGPSRSERLEAIRARIQEALVYPKAARQFGWEGTARVRMVLEPDGRLASVRLESSSQIGVLDKEVLAAVRRAGPYPYVEGPIVVPVVFDLRASEP